MEPMTRRTFLAALPAIAGFTPSGAQSTADYTLRIAPLDLEIAPKKVIRTTAYNGSVPGPLLRLRENQPVVIEVINETSTPELVHWHGLFSPAEIDGSSEEGTPFIPPHGSTRISLTPR